MFSNHVGVNPYMLKRDSPAKYYDPVNDGGANDDTNQLKRNCTAEDCNVLASDSPARHPTEIPKKRKKWRDRLYGCWRDNSYSQRCETGMEFTTLMQVPSSEGGRLLKDLVKLESSLARITNYNVKYVEKSGIPLARMFQRVFPPKSCHWEQCPVCMHSDAKKSSKCRVANIVYEAVCLECKEEGNKHTRGSVEKAVEHLLKEAGNM